MTLAVTRPGEPGRAAKRLSPRFVADAEARAALEREAAILTRLDGRGAPRLVDRGDDARGPYLVMERSPLPALATRVEDGRAVPDTWLRDAAVASLTALRAVHEASDSRGPLAVVHGDVSPDNLLVAEDGRSAVVVDFGLARYRDDPGPLGGPFRGTLPYAAPEAARGEGLDARTDLFGLAASLLAAAHGQPPRRALDFAALLANAAELPVDAWAAGAASGLPPVLAATLCRCVRFDPGDRPATAAEALSQLGRSASDARPVQ